MFYGKTTNMFGVHSYAKISVVAYGIPHSLDQKKTTSQQLSAHVWICPSRQIGKDKHERGK